MHYYCYFTGDSGELDVDGFGGGGGGGGGGLVVSSDSTKEHFTLNRMRSTTTKRSKEILPYSR